VKSGAVRKGASFTTKSLPVNRAFGGNIMEWDSRRPLHHAIPLCKTSVARLNYKEALMPHNRMLIFFHPTQTNNGCNPLRFPL
jgi:hypothetical protein